jgi:hypothetical protein
MLPGALFTEIVLLSWFYSKKYILHDIVNLPQKNANSSKILKAREEAAKLPKERISLLLLLPSASRRVLRYCRLIFSK